MTGITCFEYKCKFAILINNIFTVSLHLIFSEQLSDSLIYMIILIIIVYVSCVIKLKNALYTSKLGETE